MRVLNRGIQVIFRTGQGRSQVQRYSNLDLFKLVEDVNISMPEIFMSKLTDLPFYHVILASDDIFGKLFLGSPTVRVTK